jgi:hypothetical protein
MTRRKFEITAHMNERDFPHIVEPEPPPGARRALRIFDKHRGLILDQ